MGLLAHRLLGVTCQQCHPDWALSLYLARLTAQVSLFEKAGPPEVRRACIMTSTELNYFSSMFHTASIPEVAFLGMSQLAILFGL